MSEQQAKQYNSQYKAKSFSIIKRVLLRNINIRTIRPKKKIDYRLLGLFTITKKVGSQAYRLDLLDIYRRPYYTFYISLLELWYVRDNNPELQPILIEGEEE